MRKCVVIHWFHSLGVNKASNLTDKTSFTKLSNQPPLMSYHGVKSQQCVFVHLIQEGPTGLWYCKLIMKISCAYKLSTDWAKTSMYIPLPIVQWRLPLNKCRCTVAACIISDNAKKNVGRDTVSYISKHLRVHYHECTKLYAARSRSAVAMVTVCAVE